MSKTDDEICGKYDHELLQFNERNKYWGETLQLHNIVGSILIEFKEYDKALFYLERGYKLAKIYLNNFESESFNNLRLIQAAYWYLGEHEQCIALLNESLELELKAGEKRQRSIPATYFELGKCYFDVSDFEKALYYFQTALLYLEKLQTDLPYSRNQYNISIAKCYLKLNEIEKAIEFAKKTIDVFCYGNYILADAFFVLRDMDSALYYSKKCLFELPYKADKSVHITHKCLVYAQIAKIFLAKGESDSAYYYSKLAVENYYEESNYTMRFHKLFLRMFHEKCIIEYNLYQKRKDIKYLENAANTIVEASSIFLKFKTFMMTMGERKVISSDFKLISTAATKILLDLYREKKSNEELRKLLWVLEIDRNFTLNQNTSINKFIADNNLENDSLVVEFRTVQKNIQFFWNQSLNKAKISEGEIEKKEEFFTNSLLFIKASNLFREIVQTYPNFHNDYNLPSLTTISSIQSVLDANSILDYHTIGDSLLIFHLTKDKIKLKIIPEYSKLKKDINGFANSIRKNAISKIKLDNELLFKKLLPEELSFHRKGKLIFIADSDLTNLPFDALFDKKTNKYLIEKTAILYHYSLFSWHYSTISPPISKYNYEYIGYTPYDEYRDDIKNEYLPFANTEVINAKTKVLKTGKNAISLISSQNDKNSLLKHLSSVNIFHLVTHFNINEEVPPSSKIRLRNEDLILMDLVTTDRIDIGTFILSGCFGASENKIDKDEINSMGKLSLYLNAKNFVSSIWRMMDKPTSLFMDSFFESLTRGETTSSSLRNAKIKMIKSRQYSHPLFWAGFRCYGIN